jgi:preprotein translocase subunit YajC
METTFKSNKPQWWLPILILGIMISFIVLISYFTIEFKMFDKTNQLISDFASKPTVSAFIEAYWAHLFIGLFVLMIGGMIFSTIRGTKKQKTQTLEIGDVVRYGNVALVVSEVDDSENVKLEIVVPKKDVYFIRRSK